MPSGLALGTAGYLALNRHAWKGSHIEALLRLPVTAMHKPPNGA